MLGILLNVRLSSTRLREKHLYETCGKALIEWQILRIQHNLQSLNCKIIICTSALPENKKLMDIARKTGVDVFFGDNDNIPKRHYQCLLTFGLDHIISIDGDDILTSTSAIRKVYEELLKGREKVYTTGLPIGMNVLVSYSKKELEMLFGEVGTVTQLDTGWGVIVMKDAHEIKLSTHQEVEKLRMTVDYLDDVRFFERIFEEFGERILDTSDEDIVTFVLDQKLYEINASHS